jgi:hypothetical protein
MLALSNGLNRVAVSLPHQRTETDPVSQTLCSFVFLEYQTMDKLVCGLFPTKSQLRSTTKMENKPLIIIFVEIWEIKTEVGHLMYAAYHAA